MANYCGACGYKINDTDKFCTRCGRKTRNFPQEDIVKKEVIDKGKERLVNLVDKLKEGNEEAFREFYELTKNYVYYTIYKIINDNYAAQDLLQETYLTIYSDVSSLRDKEAVLSWIGRIAQFKTYNYLRKHNREVLLGEETPILENEEELDSALLPEEAAQSNEVRRLINEILDSLPKMQKLAIVSFYYNQMTVEETAATLNLPVGTVKTNLFRARKKIKSLVEELAYKKDTKLYSTSLAPLLLLLFKEEAKACEVPKELGTRILSKAIDNLGEASNKDLEINDKVKGQNPSNLVEGFKNHGLQKTIGQATSAVKVLAGKKLLVAAIALTTLTGAIGLGQHFLGPSPQKTLEKLEEGYNKQDIDIMIECLDPEVQKLYGGFMSLLAEFTGTDPQDILDSIIGVANHLNPYDPYKLDITINKIRYKNKDTAEVDATFTYYNELYQESSDTRITLKKIEGKWYIF